MAISSPTGAQKQPVSLPVLIAAAALLLLLIGGLAWHFLGTGRAAGTVSNDPNARWVRQKAVESQGEITRLTPDDQRHLVQLLGPQRAMTELRTQYSLAQSGK
jgi:hypothetical protein